MPPKSRLAGRRKSEKKEPKEAPKVELAPALPPPVVEDCSGIKSVNEPICAVTVMKGMLVLGHHNGIIMVVPSSLGSAGESPFEIASHRGAIKAMVGIPVPEETATAEHSVTLVTASADGNLMSHALPGGQWLMTYSGHEGPVEAACVVGNTLYSGGSDGCVRQWDVKTGECTASAKVHVGRVTGLCVPVAPPSTEEEPINDPPPSGVVVTVSDDTLVKVTNLAAKQVASVMKGDVPATSVSYLHPRIAVGGVDGHIRLFDIHTAQPATFLRGHTDAVNALLTYNGRLFSCSDDMSVRMWGNLLWETAHRFVGHTKCVTSLAVDENGSLFSGGFDASLRCWDRQSVVNYHDQVEKIKRDAMPKPPKKDPKAGNRRFSMSANARSNSIRPTRR